MSATLDLAPVVRLTRDLKEGVRLLSPQEARFLVDTYYTMQDYRIQAAGQIRALTQSDEPVGVLAWQLEQMETLENQVKRALDSWTDAQPMGIWAKSIYGIGPVISAGLLAHIDITRAPTSGHIWRFAGLDPTIAWEKGQKRPWNANLKTLCWKIGQSFMKFSNRPECVYGHYYRERKAIETAKNEAGDFADQAAKALTGKRYSADTTARAAYEQGKLPPGQIDARARRYAVKLFLAAWHEVAYFFHFGQLPPNPYPLEHLGHVHRIHPPNLDSVPGLREAKAAQGQRSL